MADTMMNPAEEAARESLDLIRKCLDEGQSFRLEAGAGSGKTESLIRTLEYLIKQKGTILLRRSQRIACITYTNVAVEEIKSRINRHPAVQSSTIHSFCWTLIKDFQPYLRELLPDLDKWSERLAELDGVDGRTILYESGHRSIEEDVVSLHHDDVLALTANLLERVKFRTILTSRYPILLIDEYQDTNTVIAEAVTDHLLDASEGPLVGLFGDHWQKIYHNGCGKIEHPRLQVINQGANFRSAPVIVDCLNRIRPDIPQQVVDPKAEGSVAVYHTNDWVGTRLTRPHWRGDLPPDVAHEHLEALQEHLRTEGWDFAPDKTKVLMLTHRALAKEQGYSNLVSVFNNSDDYIRKEDPHIAFFVDTLEPVCRAYQEERFGKMFAVLGTERPVVRSFTDKLEWAKDMDRLLTLRCSETIGAVIDHLRETRRPRLSEEVEHREQELEKAEDSPSADEPSSVKRLRKLRDISYTEVIALAHFIDGHTPFSTKHGVKGAEFRNVLVVFGRGWNWYNFNEFLELAADPTAVSADRQKKYYRNRNLFYVSCSRPQKRLALLFTQELSDTALVTLASWFGDTAIHSLKIGDC